MRNPLATARGFFSGISPRKDPMATCTNCTRTLPDDAVLCPFCGRRIAAASDAIHSDTELLHKLNQLLRREQKCLRTAWLVFATVSAVLLTETFFSFLAEKWIACLVYGILGLYGAVAALVNLVQHAHVQDCIDDLYLDCTPAMERADRRRYTVLSVFFNPFWTARIKKTKRFVSENQNPLFKIMQDQDRRYQNTFRSDLLHRTY